MTRLRDAASFLAPLVCEADTVNGPSPRGRPKRRRQDMQNTAATSGKLRSRWSAASRKARAALATVLVAATLVLPPLAAGLLAPPAHAASNTFTVNSASDFADVKVGDGVCDADFATGNLCTLRAAIQEANATTDQDTISFGISGTGVHTISPQTNLPNIIRPVTINGLSQPGSSA